MLLHKPLLRTLRMMRERLSCRSSLRFRLTSPVKAASVMVLVAATMCIGSPAYCQSMKHVLVLHSYHKGLTWTDSEDSGIRSALRKRAADVEVHTEYLDSKTIFDDEHCRKLFALLKHKYASIPLDAVIVTDDDAYNFYLKHHEALFPSAPVVFCGVNYYKDSQREGREDLVTGVVEAFDIQATLRAALQLHRRTSRIIVINDRTTTGLANKKIIAEKVVPLFSGKVIFEFFEDLTMDELLEKVGSLPPDDIILLMTFNKDRAGRVFNYDRSIALIAGKSVSPIFGVWDFYLDKGIVGGMLTSGVDQGRTAAELALRILDGEKVRSIPVVKESPNRFKFDYRQMQRFGIRTSDLPPGSVILNQPVSFYAQHKVLVWGTVSGFLGLTVIILLLLVNIRQRKRAEEVIYRLNEELEQRVKDRTAQLETTNTELQLTSQNLDSAFQELKSAQSQILQQEKMASIGQLAAGVAHEINNPMAFIISNLNSLRKYSDKVTDFINLQSGAIEELSNNADVRRIVEELEAQKKSLKLGYVLKDMGYLIDESLDGAERVKKIVQDLKTFSRLDETEFKMSDINQGLESTINIVWNDIKYKAALKKEYGNIPETACNAGQLNQVFMNILLNAAHAIEAQGEIAVTTSCDDAKIYITISDTGTGIPPDKLNRIFEPFYTTKEVGKGTGLGLSIAYDIIKKHNGEIRVESEVGKGTVFTVIVPIVDEKR